MDWSEDENNQMSNPKIREKSDLILEAAFDILTDKNSDILSDQNSDILPDNNSHDIQELQPVPFSFSVPIAEQNEPVKIYYIQPLGGPSTSSTLLTETMSLSTLLEAARFLEMQEQQQSRVQHTAQIAQTATTTIVEAQGVVRAANGGVQNHQTSIQHVYQNGNGLQTRTITLQPIKPGPGVTVALNTPIVSPVIQQSQLSQGQPAPPTQTVVISSNNISSTLLQGPISFSQTISSPTTSPTTVSIPTAIKIDQDGLIKIEQDGHISSTTALSTHQIQAQVHHQMPQRPVQQVVQRTYNNSFDIVNPLVIDEAKSDQKTKLKQPPMAFRSGTREVHNKLEKHRRAHLKECFDILKKQLMPNSEEKKTSNLSILHSALRCIQSLKRRERELEHEMERLAREKIAHQQRLAVLKKDISLHYDNIDFGKIIPEMAPSVSSVSATSEQVSSSSTSHFTPIMPQPIPEPVEVTIKTEPTVITQNTTANGLITTNGEKIAIPILSKPVSVVAHNTPITAVKEVSGIQSVQAGNISVLPMAYPVNPQGLVLQKVAIVPHTGLKELAPLVSTHFITTPQQLNGINGQLNGKMVPLTQYLVKPVVVVSTANPRSGS